MDPHPPPPRRRSRCAPSAAEAGKRPALAVPGPDPRRHGGPPEIRAVRGHIGRRVEVAAHDHEVVDPGGRPRRRVRSRASRLTPRAPRRRGPGGSRSPRCLPPPGAAACAISAPRGYKRRRRSNGPLAGARSATAPPAARRSSPGAGAATTGRRRAHARRPPRSGAGRGANRSPAAATRRGADRARPPRRGRDRRGTHGRCRSRPARVSPR